MRSMSIMSLSGRQATQV